MANPAEARRAASSLVAGLGKQALVLGHHLGVVIDQLFRLLLNLLVFGFHVSVVLLHLRIGDIAAGVIFSSR